jgi:competence protein ComFB
MLAEVTIEENDEPTEVRLTNVYESLVFDHLRNVASDLSVEAQIDAACIALNNLPPKYVRNTVDWMFFIDAKESERINRAVDRAVTNAIARVLDNPPLLEAN